jgi:two-component system, chemotaxis family, chemotaxis protein CheY
MRIKNNRNIVMVVDDDLLVRKILRGAIGAVADVVEVADGAEVVSVYKNTMPDLVFLDIHLPHKLGVEILQEIIEYDPAAHIVMLSADSSIDNVVKSKQYGIKGFLTKPFPRDRVVEHLHNCPTIVFADM